MKTKEEYPTFTETQTRAVMPTITFEKTLRSCDWNDNVPKRIAKGQKPRYIYDYKVTINGEHRATWLRNFGHNGYTLRDIFGKYIYPCDNQRPGTFCIVCRQQSEFLLKITGYIDSIPILADIEARKVSEENEERARLERDAATEKLRKIELAAPALLAALKLYVAQDSARACGDRIKLLGATSAAFAAIEQAEGVTK